LEELLSWRYIKLNEQNERNEIYNEYGEFVPRSARKKIAAMLKAQTDGPEGGFFKLNRRQFLKASALTGAVALAASSGLIYAVGRKESEAVAATSEVAEAEPVLVSAASAALEAGEEVEVANTADALVKLLEAYDIDYIFWLTDDEICPIADKLTPHVMEGRKPHPILALHEFGALAMADGYASASEKVGVTFFGANQGPMNAHGAFFNAYSSYRPIVAISAMNTAAILPMNFQYWVDPGDLVREYTKWTSHFPYPQNMPGTFIHAFATAASHPQGPVLISTSSDVWVKPMPGGTIKIPDVERLGPADAAVPNPETLEEAAELLVNADNPIITVGILGRSDEAVNQLVSLAEFAGLPVIEGSFSLYMGFPWDHPLHIGFSTSPYVNDADLVFTIEGSPPRAPETAKLIQLDVDPVKSQTHSFYQPHGEVDVRMLGEPSATIPALMEAMEDKIGPPGQWKKKVEERKEKWQQVHDQQRAEWKAEVEGHMGDKPISEWQLAYEVNQIMDDDTILYNWSIFSILRRDVVEHVIQTNKPKSWIRGSGGGHLGQSLYGAIGVACARPNRKVITCCGDLEWHMGHGFAALWTAAHHNIPILYIVVNNHLMSTTKDGQIRLQGEGYENDFWWAHEIRPPKTDFSQQANALGIWGECVKEPHHLGPALSYAMDWVQANSLPAIVDVWTEPMVEV